MSHLENGIRVRRGKTCQPLQAIHKLIYVESTSLSQNGVEHKHYKRIKVPIDYDPRKTLT